VGSCGPIRSGPPAAQLPNRQSKPEPGNSQQAKAQSGPCAVAVLCKARRASRVGASERAELRVDGCAAAAISESNSSSCLSGPAQRPCLSVPLEWEIFCF